MEKNIMDGNMIMDRKTVEKNRRIQMKLLCGQLLSLIPPHHFPPSKGLVSQVDQAITYIKHLRERVEQLEKKKKMLFDAPSEQIKSSSTACVASPILQVRDLGSTLQVNLICNSNTNFNLHQVIRIVEEGGAQVLTAIFSSIGDNIFHTLRAKVKITRIGMDATGIYGRLKTLISQSQVLSKGDMERLTKKSFQINKLNAR